MPYCLIGKVVVWGVLTLVSSCFIGGILCRVVEIIASRQRKRLQHPDGRMLLFDQITYWIIDRIDKAWVLEIAQALLALPLACLGFLELAVRYVIHRLHKPTAPAALA